MSTPSPTYLYASPSTTTHISDPTTTSSDSSSPTIASANYFFGFIITFVALLLLFVGCGVGSRRRRFGFFASAWDAGLDSEDNLVDGFFGESGRRGKQKLIYPIFWETWLRLFPARENNNIPWEDLQPVSAWSIRSPKPESNTDSKVPPQHPSESDPPSQHLPTQQPSNIGTRLVSYLFHRRQARDLPKSPPVKWHPPEAIQVAVIISMPSPLRSERNAFADIGRPSTSFRPPPSNDILVLGDYQIGVAHVPWSSGNIS